MGIKAKSRLRLPKVTSSVQSGRAGQKKTTVFQERQRPTNTDTPIGNINSD